VFGFSKSKKNYGSIEKGIRKVSLFTSCKRTDRLAAEGHGPLQPDRPLIIQIRPQGGHRSVVRPWICQGSTSSSRSSLVVVRSILSSVIGQRRSRHWSGSVRRVILWISTDRSSAFRSVGDILRSVLPSASFDRAVSFRSISERTKQMFQIFSIVQKEEKLL